MLNESNIRRAFHWTTLNGLHSMVKSNMLSMSTAYGGAREEKYSMGKYPFFLSTTQYGTDKEGYGKEMSMMGNSILLELDTQYLSNKGRFKRIQYYPDSVRPEYANSIMWKYESEDRFLTKNSSLPFDKAVIKVTAPNGLPKDIIDKLNIMGVEYKGSERQDFHRDYNNYDIIKLLSMIRRLWGNSAMEASYDRIKHLVPFSLEDALGYNFDLYASWGNPVAMEAMRGIFVKAMRKGIPFRELEKALFGNEITDRVKELF